MTSLLAIPCSVMNLVSRSDAEDSNALEITGFGALICYWDTANGNWRIVSQGHDKVFTLKMPGNRLFRWLFAFDKAARDYHGVLDCLTGADLDVIRENRSTYLRTRADFDIVPEDRLGNSC